MVTLKLPHASLIHISVCVCMFACMLHSSACSKQTSKPRVRSRRCSRGHKEFAGLEGMKEKSRRLMKRVSFGRDYLERQSSANDQATSSLRSLAQSSRLFPAYLCLNHRGWQIVSVNHHPQPDSSSTITRPVRGFEAVWLADQDELCPATKDWTHFPRETSTPPSSTTASEHALFKRSGQGEIVAFSSPHMTEIKECRQMQRRTIT